VKIYLISFSEQQKEVLDKVRNFLSSLEEEKNKTPEKESKSSRCSTPKSKGRPPAKSKAKAKSSKNSSEATPEDSEDESDEIFLAYLNSDSGYRGHVEEYDISPGVFERDDEPVEEFIRQIETTETLENIEKEKFLDSIDLVAEPSYKSAVSRILELRRRKHYLVVSYVPDPVDKRIAGGYRYQTFLQNTVTSPPHLRTRKQNQLPTLPPRASTRSVAAPVEKMETRNKSLNLFRSQLDGCTDQIEAEAEGVAMEDQGETLTSLQERLAVRNHLLKRKLEMEDEMMHLQKRACVLQDRKERQREEKLLLLKEQKETELKIQSLLQYIADLAASSSSATCL